MKKKFDKRRLLPALTLAALALAVLAPFGWFAARDAAARWACGCRSLRRTPRRPRRPPVRNTNFG